MTLLAASGGLRRHEVSYVRTGLDGRTDKQTNRYSVSQSRINIVGYYLGSGLL